MNTIEAIKSRHSVRSYVDKEIDERLVAILQKEVEKCNAESGLHLQLVTDEPGGFSGMMAKYGRFANVKNYFVLVGKKSKDLDEKVGYYGEHLVLEAQKLGLNTCWVALTYNRRKAKFNIEPGEKLVCVISLGYGENQGKERRSKTLEEVSNISEKSEEWFKKGVESALLAPTAMNQQKFYFEKTESGVKATAGLGFYAKVDLGIAKYHFEVGAGKENFIWEK